MSQPQHEYLTVAESESLHNKALRQQAKTIDTFLSIAALTGISDPDTQRGVARIRELDKSTARRYGKQLLHTLQVFNDLLPADPDREETPQASAPFSEIQQPTTNLDTENETEEGEQLDGLSKTGHRLAKTLLGDEFQVEDYTVEQIAQMIYDKAGEPVSYKYTESGKVLIDPMERLIARLEGSSYDSIAEHEGDVTKAAVQIWFSTKFIKPIREMESRIPQRKKAALTLEVFPTTDLQEKIYTPQDGEDSSTVDGENLAAFEGLMNANFTHEEAVALMECFEFDDGNPKERRDEASVALKKLQGLLVKQAKNIGDHPALPGLRMLSNPIFGNKTVYDVYLSMHKRDTQITQDKVTGILKHGTTLLAGGKEHDS